MNGGAAALSVEHVNPGKEAVGLIPVVTAHCALVGSVSV